MDIDDKPRRTIRRDLLPLLPDARSPDVRERLATQVARLDPDGEKDAMDWIEAVSEFDNEGHPVP